MHRPLSAKAATNVAYRLAICGAGPAGLTALKALENRWRSRSPKNARLHVDVFDASLVPGGLIRDGVAPDNMPIKQLGEKLIQHAQILRENQNDPASPFSFEFFGGVEIGKWLNLRSIRHAYDSVLMATGIPAVALDETPTLGLAHEWVGGVATAKEVVRLYNGAPLRCPKYLYDLYGRVPGVMAEAGQWTVDSKLLDYSLARSASVTSQDPSYPTRREMASFGNLFDPSRTEKNVVILGQGNVALDVSRILLTAPSSLPPHQVPKAARSLLSAFHSGRDADIHICGRRGALQSTWDTVNLRELFNLSTDVKVMVRADELQASISHPVAAKELRKNRAAQRLVALLEQGVQNSLTESETRNRVWLRYLLSPTELKVDVSEATPTGAVRRIEFDRNVLSRVRSGGKGAADLGSVKDKHSTSREIIDEVCLVIKSMGYGRTEKPPWQYLEGTEESRLGRRMKSGETSSMILPRDETSAPVFMTGWLRSGGKGNMMESIADAKRVSEAILTEVEAEASVRENGDSLLAELLCMRATVPEIGIPVDWDEAMRLLDAEAAMKEKISEWQRAADLVNEMRQSCGPRSEKWQEKINRLKPRCLAH